MPTWSKLETAPQHFGILVFDGFSNHCLANTVEPLRAANTLLGREAYRWTFLSLEETVITSSSGLQVQAQQRLSQTAGDTLVVMPSYGFHEHGGWRTQAALRSASRRFRNLAGLDTGSWLLAEAGLLDGYKATIHWEELTAFSERFPDVHVQRQRYVIDRQRITSSGATAAFDLALHLIGRDHGQALALEVAQLFMMPDSARSHAGTAGSRSAMVNRALAIMQENLEQPISIPEIARRVGRTQKTLEAKMQSELGAGPARVYRRLRLNLARKLVTDTGLSIGEIALRAGYEDPSAMTRAFRTEFGITPRALRAD